MGAKGLNTTWKLSVVALAVLGPAASEAAEAVTTPARASTRAAAVPVSATFRMVPPLGCRATPMSGSGSSVQQPCGGVDASGKWETSVLRLRFVGNIGRES